MVSFREEKGPGKKVRTEWMAPLSKRKGIVLPAVSLCALSAGPVMEISCDGADSRGPLRPSQPVGRLWVGSFDPRGRGGSPMTQLLIFAASRFGMLVPVGTHFGPMARLAAGDALRGILHSWERGSHGCGLKLALKGR